MEVSSICSEREALRVLVVDDHSINRAFLKSAMPRDRFHVDEAGSGRQAIECCRRVEYDLILMDLHMPEQDGLATAEALGAVSVEGQHTPIVFLTADTRPAVRDRLRARGYPFVLSKPLSVGELFRRLKDWQLIDARVDLLDSAPRSDKLIDGDSALATCNGQPDLVCRMQRMLANDLDERLSELDRHVSRADWSEAAALLHQWMGAAGYAGAGRLADRAAALKSALPQGNEIEEGNEIEGREDVLADTYFRFLRCARATRDALDNSGTSE